MGSMNRDPPPYSPEEEGSVHKLMIAVELILIVSEVKLHYPNEGFLTNGVGLIGWRSPRLMTLRSDVGGVTPRGSGKWLGFLRSNRSLFLFRRGVRLLGNECDP